MRTELQDLEPDEQIVPGVNRTGTTETREGKEHVNYAHEVTILWYMASVVRCKYSGNLSTTTNFDGYKIPTVERRISSKTR